MEPINEIDHLQGGYAAVTLPPSHDAVGKGHPLSMQTLLCDANMPGIEVERVIATSDTPPMVCPYRNTLRLPDLYNRNDPLTWRHLDLADHGEEIRRLMATAMNTRSASDPNMVILRQANFMGPYLFRHVGSKHLNNMSEKKSKKGLLSESQYNFILKALLKLKQRPDEKNASDKYRALTKFGLTWPLDHRRAGQEATDEEVERMTSEEKAELVIFKKKNSGHSGTELILPAVKMSKLHPITTYAHAISGHGGRDKTSRLIASLFTYVPKELVSRYIWHCPDCRKRRAAAQTPRGRVMTEQYFHPLGLDNCPLCKGKDSNISANLCPRFYDTDPEFLDVFQETFMPGTVGRPVELNQYAHKPIRRVSSSRSESPLPPPHPFQLNSRPLMPSPYTAQSETASSPVSSVTSGTSASNSPMLSDSHMISDPHMQETGQFSTTQTQSILPLMYDNQSNSTPWVVMSHQPPIGPYAYDPKNMPAVNDAMRPPNFQTSDADDSFKFGMTVPLSQTSSQNHPCDEDSMNQQEAIAQHVRATYAYVSQDWNSVSAQGQFSYGANSSHPVIYPSQTQKRKQREAKRVREIEKQRLGPHSVQRQPSRQRPRPAPLHPYNQSSTMDDWCSVLSPQGFQSPRQNTQAPQVQSQYSTSRTQQGQQSESEQTLYRPSSTIQDPSLEQTQFLMPPNPYTSFER